MLKRVGKKSIKQALALFLWITVLVVVICSIFTFVLLYNNIDNAKKSAVDSAYYSAERLVNDHLEAMTETEGFLRNSRDIQVYLNEINGEDVDMLKINAAESIQKIVGVKGMGLGVALFANDGDTAVLCSNADQTEAEYIKKSYDKYSLSHTVRYEDSTDKEIHSELYIFDIDNALYPEFYMCSFTPVVYHSLKTVDTYEVGTMAVFSKVNTYELKNNVKRSSVMTMILCSEKSGENVVLVDTSENGSKNGMRQIKRIGYSDLRLDIVLYKLIGVSFVSPFVVMSIVLIIILLLCVLLLRKSAKTLVDTPVKRISKYLEEFVLSKRDRTVLETVEIAEFDDLLEYINELLERVTEQAHYVVSTQQEMYEKELLANEQTLYMNQLQINPHFLFNTLNTIAQMCNAKGMDDVTDIIHSISEIFRYTIKGDYKTTIDNEIYIVLKYIKILNKRYGREFECELDIEDELYEFEVLKMILQPLIENSFKHGGIANVENPVIRVSAHEIGDEVIVSVYDNGAGIDSEKLKAVRTDLKVATRQKNNSIGLFNINRRLKAFYGEESRVEVNSEQGEFTEVSIIIKENKNK